MVIEKEKVIKTMKIPNQRSKNFYFDDFLFAQNSLSNFLVLFIMGPMPDTCD